MSFCSPSLWQMLLLYSHPHTVQNNIANFCESMVFLCAPFHIPCVHESFLAHKARNVTDWFIIVSSIVQLCVPGQVLLCRKRLVAQVARVIDGTWIQSFALLTKFNLVLVLKSHKPQTCFARLAFVGFSSCTLYLWALKLLFVVA